MIEQKDFPWLGVKFKEYFGLELNKYIEPRMLVASKTLMFDMLKFCDWLDIMYPKEIMVKGTTYGDLVRRHYGADAENFIRRLI